MKPVTLLVAIIWLLSATKAEAQQLNYQGIARNANGVALSFQQISLKLSIRDGSANGVIVYSETRLVRTNQFGLFTVVIGGSGATNVSGSFNTINWITGNKFLQVEIDPDGGSNFLNAGTSQLQSVPFAFFAAAAYPVGNAGGDLAGSTYPNPQITAAAVTTNKIANAAITNEKIKDSTIANNKLVNSIVTINDQQLPLGGAQYFAVGTAGSNFNIRSQDSIHTFNIPTASATARGLLSPTSFTVFTNKQDALVGTGFVKSTLGVISYDNTNYVPFARTINGLDLSANRIFTTDNFGEGTTNLYFTNIRSRAALTGGNGINYNNSTGSISSSFGVGGQTYLSYAPTTGVLTASAVDLSGTQVTGTLAAARFGALTGDITNTTGSYATSISNGAVTNAKIADNTISNIKLQNSSFTLGATAISLGAAQTSLTGLTSVTSTSFTGALTGNASTATTATTAATLQNARTFSVTGDVTATAQSFNGSANVTLSTTLANTGVTAATYGGTTSVPTITVDAKGRITNAVATTITGVSTIGSTLNSANIIVGNASNQASAVAMSGDITISNTGATTIANSAVTNTKLQNSGVTIGSTVVSLGATQTSFTGLTSVTSTSFTGALTGNASTATTLQNIRTFAATGDITANAQNFDGSANVSLTTALANTGVTAATYGGATSVPTITVDAKGRITNATSTIITGVSNIGSTLNSANIIVGNATSQAAAVAMSGDIAISNTGATTIATNAVTTTKIATNNVTLDKLEQIPAGHILMNNTLATGNVQSQSIPDVLTQFSIRNQTTQQVSSNFNISGSGTIANTMTTSAAVYGYRSLTSTSSLNSTDHYIKVTTASVTITLPSPSIAGRRIVVANRSVGSITIITPTGSIVGYSFAGTLGVNESLSVFADGTDWQLESKYN